MVAGDAENGPEDPNMDPAVVVTVVVTVVAEENSPVDAVVAGDENKPVGTVDEGVTENTPVGAVAPGTDENKPPGAVDAAVDENKPVLGAAEVENSPLVGVVETVAAANKLPLDVVAAGTDENKPVLDVVVAGEAENKPVVGATEAGTEENSPTAGVVDGVETALDTVGEAETEVLDGVDTVAVKLVGGAWVDWAENNPDVLVVVVPEAVVALGKDVAEICGEGEANNVLDGTGELVGDLKSPAPTFLGVPKEIFPPPNMPKIKIEIIQMFYG